MTELWNEVEDKSEIILLEQSDVKDIFDTREYDRNLGHCVSTNDSDVAEKFMQKYGAKVGSKYFIEKERFLEIIRQTGNILEDNKF